MPIYEFDCANCGDSFDKLVRSMSAVSSVTCPSCDSPDVKKKVSLFSSKMAGGSIGASASSAPSCSPGGL